MGVYVEFKEARPDGLESALLGSLPSFHEWAVALYTDPDSGFGSIPMETLEKLLQCGAAALAPGTVEEAMRIDAVVDLFVGDYCDWGPGRTLFRPLDPSMLPLRHYEAAAVTVAAAGSADLLHFWTAIAHGRPLRREGTRFPYHPADPVFRVSFLTAPEVARLAIPLSDLCQQRTRGLSAGPAAALEAAARALREAALRGIGALITAA